VPLTLTGPLRSDRPRLHWIAAALMFALLVVGAWLVYRPILRIGLLSDDFPILMWARRLELLPRDWGQMRPVPILGWWVIARLAPAARVPEALHLLNVIAHGLNAFLVWLLARRLTTSTFAPIAAAAVFLVMPVSVEPVAWPSGVFDVMLATFALGLALVVSARPDLGVREWILALLLGVLMIASKETGVIAGLLTLLVSWTRWGRLRRGVIALAATQLLIAGGYVLARQLTDRLDHRLTPHATMATVGRLVSQSFGALIVPLHTNLLHAHPLLAAAGVALLVGALVAWPLRWRHDPAAARLAVLAAAGVLVSVGPAITLFGILPDLQGSRYVYLASAWWSIAVAAALLEGWTTAGQRAAAGAVTLVLVSAAAVATTAHLEPWIEARNVRDRVLREVTALPSTCIQASAPAAPDHVDGAYVFRNGLNQAIATLGRSFEWVEPEKAAPECQVRSFAP
jgi:hypothetical protein